MPEPESFQDLMFPTSGLDLQEGYGSQRPGSTRIGTNVRAFEPGSQRMRGGSRSGLSRYLPQLPSGATKIQHLNVVVDPSGDALLANFTFPLLDLVDPSSVGLPADWPPGQTSRIFPGQMVPTGGTGVQPNKKKPLGGVVHHPIQLVQSKLKTTGSFGATASTFTSDVTSGDLLLVAVQQRYFTSSSLAVSDSQGNLYSQAGSFSTVPGDTKAVVSLWYAIANASGGDTVTATAANDALAIPIYLTEWSGVRQTSPLDGTGTGGADQSGVSGSATLGTGSVTLSGSGELLFGFFAVADNPGDAGSFTAGSGFTNLATALGKCGTYQVVSSAGALAASVACFLNSNSRWAGVAASFKAA